MGLSDQQRCPFGLLGTCTPFLLRGIQYKPFCTFDSCFHLHRLLWSWSLHHFHRHPQNRQFQPSPRNSTLPDLQDSSRLDILHIGFPMTNFHRNNRLFSSFCPLRHHHLRSCLHLRCPEDCISEKTGQLDRKDYPHLSFPVRLSLSI